MTETEDAGAVLMEMWKEMNGEIETLAHVVPGNPTTPTEFPDPVLLNPIERRMLVKTVFSFIEALSYCMKAWSIDTPTVRERLSTGELILAAEESHELETNGQVVTRKARLRTVSNIRFAFNIFAKAHGAIFELDVGGAGWQSLQRAIKVRDRLMHPKHTRDLCVSDEEIRDTLASYKWFRLQHVRILAAIVRSLRAQVSSRRSQLENLETLTRTASEPPDDPA